MQSVKTKTIPQCVHLFLFPYSEIETPELALRAKTVSSDPRVENFEQSQNRHRSFVAGRCAIAIAFKRLGIDASVSPNSKYGFLELVPKTQCDSPEIKISLSHTEELVAVAISPLTIGVDIELKDRDASKVMGKVATESDLVEARQGVYAANGVAVPPEIAIWCSKEAVSKAVGLGMHQGLKDFKISFLHSYPYPVAHALKGPLELHEGVVALDYFENYLIAICGEKSIVESGGIRRNLIGVLDFI